MIRLQPNSILAPGSKARGLLGASLLLVAMPGAPSSVLVTTSFLLLVEPSGVSLNAHELVREPVRTVSQIPSLCEPALLAKVWHTRGPPAITLTLTHFQKQKAWDMHAVFLCQSVWTWDTQDTNYPHGLTNLQELHEKLTEALLACEGHHDTDHWAAHTGRLRGSLLTRSSKNCKHV